MNNDVKKSHPLFDWKPYIHFASRTKIYRNPKCLSIYKQFLCVY